MRIHSLCLLVAAAACTSAPTGGDLDGGSPGDDAPPGDDARAADAAPPRPAGQIVGYGARAAPGWESWATCHVTRLAYDGEGTLKRCLSTSGPVHIVFDVAGTIVAPDLGGGVPWTIDRSGVVIDGLSAPAPGITISQPLVIDQDNMRIVGANAADIIIMGVRFLGPYEGGPFRGSNNQALPTVDGDSQQAPGTVRRVVFYRDTFAHTMDGAPDLWGATADVTFQECLWLGNRHATTVARPPDNFPGAGVCTNEDGTLCHADGATWFRNAFLDNFERQVQVRAGEHLEYVNNVIHGWGAPNPSEGGGYGLRISPKSGPYPFGSVNLYGNAFVDSTNRPDEGCVYGDLAKGTPENDGSKARAWFGNSGLVSRIWTDDNRLPPNRQYRTYNCTTTPGAAGGPFAPPTYAQIPETMRVASSELADVIDGAGMPWPSAEELAAKAEAMTAYLAQ